MYVDSLYSVFYYITDYNTMMLGVLWLYKYYSWVLLLGVVLIFIFKNIYSYQWYKLLGLYIVQTVSYYIGYIANPDVIISGSASISISMIVSIFAYLYTTISIKLMWLNILFFSRDEFFYDIEAIWNFFKNIFSKIKSASKNNKTKVASTTYQKVLLKQKPIQHSQVKTKVQTKTQQPQSKNLILPKTADIEINNKGKKVYTDKGYAYTLQKQIGFGGEGTVHIISKQQLAKIFYQDKATNEKLKKLQKFLSMRKIASVIFPEKILYDKNKKFIGYTMPQVFGVKELGVLHSKKNREKYCPNWTYIDLLDLSLSIARTLQKLHDARIIVADFNPRNVLVKSPKKIYFIDIDSYQVDRQPSTVGIMMYTRPIHTKKSHKEYLKNKSDDLYALSMMIFQNLTSGGNPYTTKQGGTEDELIQRHEFAFNVKEPHKSNANSALINAWSNLSIELRQFFEDVFRYQKPVLLSTLTQALQAHKRSLIRVQTKIRSK